MGPANSQMISLARESRLLTQRELAKKAGVAQGTISKTENGQTPATQELVERIAPALDYPVSLFYYDPPRVKNLPIPFYRKRIRVPSKIERSVRASMNLRRFELEKLLRSVEIPELRVPLLRSAEYHGDMERVAREVRTRWHIRPGPIENLTTLMESVGVLILPFDFGTNQIVGMSVCEPDDDLPPVILMNPTIPGDRWRHTVAHELAHVMLHNHLELPGESIEDEANRFAGAFLMPASDIKGHLNRVSIERLADLKPYWKTSIRSMVIRAYQLDRISEWQYARFFRQLNARYGATNEPVQIPREEPTLIAEIIKTHTVDLGYTEDQMRGLLCLNPNEYRGFYASRQAPPAQGLTLRAVK